jgi:hypothetical protein
MFQCLIEWIQNVANCLINGADVSACQYIPSFEEGTLRRINRCHATENPGAAGEVRKLFDLPAGPMFKVTFRC